MATQAIETEVQGQAKESRSFGIGFASRGDVGLRLRAQRTRAGWRTEVHYRQGKTRSRGMSADHATAEQARAVLEKLAEQAAKLGWTRREAGGGFARKPDAFATNAQAGHRDQEVAPSHPRPALVSGGSWTVWPTRAANPAPCWNLWQLSPWRVYTLLGCASS